MIRNVIVTGGGTGIGRATAIAFAAQGDSVMVVGRRRAPLDETCRLINERAGSERADALCCDLTDSAAVVASLGDGDQVDVLVNNAGGAHAIGGDDLAALANRWRADFATNVLTAVLATEAVRPRLRRPGGRVINLSSIAALRGGGDSYGATKAALIGWSYTLAAALGSDGITVNVVAPGFVDKTELFGAEVTDESRRRLISQTLVGRAGTSDDVAATICFLASASAGYITGQVVQVNGGALLGR